MTSRGRPTEAQHAALLASDAPLMNRCDQEELHLKHRLARATAAFALNVQQNQSLADREERSREVRLQAQFTELLAGTRGLEVPSVARSSPTTALANAAKRGRGGTADAVKSGVKSHPTPSTGAIATTSVGLKTSSAATDNGRITHAAHPPYSIGFPDEYKSSGFKSPIRWASVMYDETFLTVYGPRGFRDQSLDQVPAGAERSPMAREAFPHRFMAAVTCYLLNEVLCANPMLSKLWQEKLRQPIFDSVFSPQSIAMGRDQNRVRRGGGAGNAAVADAIVRATMKSDFPPPSTDAVPSTTSALFPHRTNTYTTQGEFASLRLWAEEVAIEHQEKVCVCQRVCNLQRATTSRYVAVDMFQRREQKMQCRSVFMVWRSHTHQRRKHRQSIERFLTRRHLRHLEETTFLRWRGFVVRVKATGLQQRLVEIEISRSRVISEHTAALNALQEKLVKERSRHMQESFERETLHAQILDNHSMEIEALRMMLHTERMRMEEFRKWVTRWERAAKTFRPAKPCPPVPCPLWTIACSLLKSEEAFANTALKQSGVQETLLRVPYPILLEARQRMEELLLVWVNAVMQDSPEASTWIHVDAFKYGYSSLPKKQSSLKKSSSEASGEKRDADGSACDFSIYALMCLVRELRRRYEEAGLVARAAVHDRSHDANVADFYRELTNVFAVQAGGGLYAPLLAHCPSSPLWFTAEGLFGGPMSNMKLSARQHRRHHTVLMWVLASLLVGHIRVTWLASLLDKRVQPVRSPMEEMETLECTRESEMMKLTQLSFPMQHSKAAAGPPAAPRGTKVVASNTLLPKKKLSLSSSLRASARAAEDAEEVSIVSTEMSLLDMLRARQRATHHNTKRDSNDSNSSANMIRNELLGLGDDSLSDIEAFLGMQHYQVNSLRGIEGSSDSEEGDDDDDRWINRLFHQVFKAEEAEAEQRRIVRLQSKEVPQDATEMEDVPLHMPRSSKSGDIEECEGVSVGSNSATPAAAEAASISKTTDGDMFDKKVFLTGDQMRLLRSLPGRSYGFDTLRPVVVASSDTPPETEDPLVGSATSTSSSSIYSFLLNSLDDVEARQQWCGLARVVTSLVVRFHLLDDSEEIAMWTAVQPEGKGESEEPSMRQVLQRSHVTQSRSLTPPGAPRLPPVSVGDNLTKEGASTARASTKDMTLLRSGSKQAALPEGRQTHTQAAPTVDFDPAGGNRHAGKRDDVDVEEEKTDLAGGLARVTSTDNSRSRRPMTGNLRTLAGTANDGRKHVPENVLRTKKEVENLRTSIRESLSSMGVHVTAPQTSKGLSEEHSRAVTFSDTTNSEIHPHVPMSSRGVSSSIPPTFVATAQSRGEQENVTLPVRPITAKPSSIMAASQGGTESVSAMRMLSSPSGGYNSSIGSFGSLPPTHRESASPNNRASSPGNTTQHFVKPPTLRAPKSPMDSGNISTSASLQQSGSLSPLVLHASNVKRSLSSTKPKDHFRMDC